MIRNMARVCIAAALLAAIGGWLMPNESVAQRSVLLSEDFEGVPLGPNVQEGLTGDDPRDEVWSPTGPDGWTVDRSNMPTDGMTEWWGWTFADTRWWDEVAGQDRAFFTFGTGLVTAIADSDEWDDASHPPGDFNSFLSTPPIDISTISANQATLVFDSSWRPEGDQTATITAAYDGADPIEVFRYDSTNTEDGCCNPEEGLEVNLNNPAGASSVVLSFGYTNADNNWWWAVDNIEVGGPGGAVFSEDFESVQLGPNVEEARGIPNESAWSDTFPDGWEVFDDPDMPGLEDDTVGVREWEGWTVADKQFWIDADDQNRSHFTKATGAVAVADPDEWDDIGSPASQGKYNSWLSTPVVSLEGVEANSVEVAFDSSWRDEAFDDGDGTNNQTATVTVQFDNDDPVEILRWESDSGSPDFKDDSENESVSLNINNPAGASSMRLTFGLTEAGNDWWWAIDNLEISGEGGTGGVITPLQAGDANQDLSFDQFDLIAVQQAAKYLTGEAATWGEGDWDAAPGGKQGSPPAGNGFFDQIDIIAALTNGLYLQGPYGAISPGGEAGDEQTSVVYNPTTGEVGVDAPASTELTSINIQSTAGIFTGDPAQNLGGSFDNDADDNIFKATFGSSFGSLSFGAVAQAGLSEEFVANDLSVVGSLSGGGALGDVDLIYVPEPGSLGLLLLGGLGLAVTSTRRRRRSEL